MSLIQTSFSELGLTIIGELLQIENIDFLRGRGFAPLENNDRAQLSELADQAPDGWVYSVVWSLREDDPCYALRQWFGGGKFSPFITDASKIDISRPIILKRI